ncbi:MAG: non-ribosomal peptide synthetase, partial [Blastocatellia bacterium]
MLLSVHHIIVDFWSLAIFVDELGTLYESSVNGTPVALPALSARYHDFVRWQAEMIESEEGRRHREYWHGQLAGELPACALPTNRLPGKAQTFRGTSHAFELGRSLAEGLKGLAASHEATLHAALLACLQALIHRYTHQNDILIGSPAACRTRPEWAGVVGYFVNPVIVRADVSGSQSFSVLLHQSTDRLISALEHQDYPFALLVEEIAPARDLSRPPVFQIMLVLEKSHRMNETGLPTFALGEAGNRMELGGLALESISLPGRAAQVDLSFIMAQAHDGLAVSIEYNSDLFDAPAVSRMACHFRNLINDIVNNADRPVAGLQLLSRAEESQLVIEWNDTRVVVPQQQSMHEEFECQVRRSPDRIAVLFQDSSISYERLNKRANQLAHFLSDLGVGPETRVAICLDRSDEMVIALVAVLKAGGAYVPLDPKYPKERLAFQISDSDARILVAQDLTISAASGANVRILNLDEQSNAIAAHSTVDPGLSLSPRNLAYVIYTSGSTGRPKGVGIEHRSALTFLAWARGAFPAESLTGVLASTSICFDLSIFEVFVPLGSGGTLILVDNVLQVPDCPS